MLLDLLLKHRDKLRRLAPDSEATRRVKSGGGEAQPGGGKDGANQSVDQPLEDLFSADVGLVGPVGYGAGVRATGALADAGRTAESSATLTLGPQEIVAGDLQWGRQAGRHVGLDFYDLLIEGHYTF